MNAIRAALKLWKREGGNGTPLHRRLIAFFAMMVVFVLASFTLTLVLVDYFGGRGATLSYMDAELTHVSEYVNRDFGKLSVQGVRLCEAIAESSNRFFEANDVTAQDFTRDDAIVEEYLRAQMQTLVSAMDSVNCSGVFIMLDAPGSESTLRSGFFLKRTTFAAAGGIEAKTYCLRGPAKLAREYGIELLGQWHMEYDMAHEDFFTEVMEMAETRSELPLSRLYSWSERVTLYDNSESGLLMRVPLIARDGHAYGVCGIEVSDRLFKLLYTPDNTTYKSAFCAFARREDDVLRIDNGLIAGNSYLSASRISTPLDYDSKLGEIIILKSTDAAYGARQAEVRLYPDDSPYAGDTRTVSVMLDYEALMNAVRGGNSTLLFISFAVLAVSLVLSVGISRRYLRPVTDGLNAIKEKNFDAAGNTYLEISDLMEYLAEQEKSRPVAIVEPSGDITPLFDEFLANIKTLSPAERNVFELYMKGLTAKEIAETLCLSINTIKTHNRRIFTKLNVSTRKELMVYIDMMRDLGMISEA